MLNIYKELVPNSIDSETFWSRYYYKVFKLKQAEDMRAKLVKSAISKEEEVLSWDVFDDDDDDDDEQDTRRSINAGDAGSVIEKVDNAGEGSKLEKNVNLTENKAPHNDSGAKITNENFVEDSKTDISIADEKGKKIPNADDGSKGGVTESSGNKGLDSESDAELSKNEAASESNDEVALERKGDLGESKPKDNDFSMVSSQPSMPEEKDLDWDEIEDLSGLDEKKPLKSGSPNKGDLRKRLNAAEEDYDLSWDTEDDDEPTKS